MGHLILRHHERGSFGWPLSNCNVWMVLSRGECGSFLFPFAVTCCRKTGCPQRRALMTACGGLPRCKNNITTAGQVAMQERRVRKLNNEGYASKSPICCQAQNSDPLNCATLKICHKWENVYSSVWSRGFLVPWSNFKSPVKVQILMGHLVSLYLHLVFVITKNTNIWKARYLIFTR